MKKKYVLIALIISLSVGCATTNPPPTSLEQRIQAAPTANTPEEIAQRAADTFSSAPGLTEDQRKRLQALYLKTYAESRQIRTQIGKMKSLLFQEAANKKFDSKDMKSLVQKIIDADQKRLTVMFAAFQEMQNIVGYGVEKQQIYERLKNYDYPGNAHR